MRLLASEATYFLGWAEDLPSSFGPSPPSGGFPAVLDNLWLGEEEAQAVATALQPKLAKTRGAIDGILADVATLEVQV